MLGFAGALDELLLAAARRTIPPLARGGGAARARARCGGPARRCSRSWRPACRSGPRIWEREAAAGCAGLLALRDELAAGFPGVLLTIDLAEFARSNLDPRLAGGEAGPPYYDGLVFRAYAGACARCRWAAAGATTACSARLGAEVPAVGFSLEPGAAAGVGGRHVIRLALPKGRNLEPALAAFRAAGICLDGLDGAGRSLRTRLPEDGIEVLSLKDWDLPLYVEHGVADCGIVGSDVLGEVDGDLLVPVRLLAGALAAVA